MCLKKLKRQVLEDSTDNAGGALTSFRDILWNPTDKEYAEPAVLRNKTDKNAKN
jgi:hypothetical protein